MTVLAQAAKEVCLTTQCPVEQKKELRIRKALEARARGMGVTVDGRIE